MTLQRLVEEIDSLESKSISDLKKVLKNDSAVEFPWRQFLPEVLPKDEYHRKLLHSGGGYEVLLLVWPEGSETLPHNHGSPASHGVIRILKNNLGNSIYRKNGDKIMPVEEQVFREGDLIEIPNEMIHSMGNCSQKGFSVSLHVYAPQIIDVTYWDPVKLVPRTNGSSD